MVRVLSRREDLPSRTDAEEGNDRASLSPRAVDRKRAWLSSPSRLTREEWRRVLSRPLAGPFRILKND